MITINNTQFTSDISLAAIMNVMTKVKMIDICKKLDLYVSPNLKKDETARRIAREILENPCDVLHVLNKQELQMVDEFVKAGPNKYVQRKMRKTPYKHQKFGLVLTYEDEVKALSGNRREGCEIAIKEADSHYDGIREILDEVSTFNGC